MDISEGFTDPGTIEGAHVWFRIYSLSNERRLHYSTGGQDTLRGGIMKYSNVSSNGKSSERFSGIYQYFWEVLESGDFVERYFIQTYEEE